LEDAAWGENARVGPTFTVEFGVVILTAEKDLAGNFRSEALALHQQDICEWSCFYGRRSASRPSSHLAVLEEE